MSSNEEYLDSLLQSLTGEEESEAADSLLDDGANMQMGNDGEDNNWDGISSDALEQMLANVENLNIDEAEQNSNGKGVFSNLADEVTRIAEEKAFSDPGALFFEGEEEEEVDLISMADGMDEYTEESSETEDNGDIADIDFTMTQEEDEDLIALADQMEEGIVSLPDSGEAVASEEDLEELRALVGDTDEVAESADGVEEDLIALADSVEEEAVDVMDVLGMGTEEGAESVDASDVSVAEEELTEETGEEDLIALADSAEEYDTDVMNDIGLFEEESSTPVTDDEGFKEINDLLASSTSEGDDDMFAMLEGVEQEDGASDIGLFELEQEPEQETDEETEGKKKKKKAKEKKAVKDGVVSGEKKGVFARFMEFLLEEDEDEEEEESKKAAGDEVAGEISDENSAILEELNGEDAEGKKGKSDKKDKKKKGKKGKDAAEESEDGEESEEAVDDKKKKKKEKKEKKKAEKEEKAKELAGEKTKKLSAKKIEVTVVFCLTILAGILLTIQLLPPAMEKNRARDAYYAKDYERVLEGFYGEKLSESDSIMYNRAYIILKMQRKIDAYNNFMYMGKETEALNQLIEGIFRYNELYEDAMQYNIVVELDEMYQTIMEALQNKYGLSLSEAVEIYGIEDDFAYTLKLESIIDGVEYALPSVETEEAGETEAAEETQE